MSEMISMSPTTWYKRIIFVQDQKSILDCEMLQAEHLRQLNRPCRDPETGEMRSPGSLLVSLAGQIYATGCRAREDPDHGALYRRAQNKLYDEGSTDKNSKFYKAWISESIETSNLKDNPGMLSSAARKASGESPHMVHK